MNVNSENFIVYFIKMLCKKFNVIRNEIKLGKIKVGVAVKGENLLVYGKCFSGWVLEVEHLKIWRLFEHIGVKLN
jgi:hypothetical protein